jgi:hypothetical protein
MSSIVSRIVSVLEPNGVSDDAAAVDDALLNAAFLFEKARGLPPSAWPAEVINSHPTAANVRRLRDAVASFAERTGLGAWALGKCGDASLKPVLMRIVRRQLLGDPGELFQAMIALENLGDPVFGGMTSRSIRDEGHNRELAQRYLETRPQKS